jgi:CPA1 family monovalent cation:H+ antiporter
MAWPRLISCTEVLNELKIWTQDEKIPATVAASVAKIWQGWLDGSETKMAAIKQQQPLLSAKVQRRLLRNYLLTIQSEHVQEHVQEYVQKYLISESDAARIKKLLTAIINSLTDD